MWQRHHSCLESKGGVENCLQVFFESSKRRSPKQEFLGFVFRAPNQVQNESLRYQIAGREDSGRSQQESGGLTAAAVDGLRGLCVHSSPIGSRKATTVFRAQP